VPAVFVHEFLIQDGAQPRFQTAAAMKISEAGVSAGHGGIEAVEFPQERVCKLTRFHFLVDDRACRLIERGAKIRAKGVPCLFIATRAAERQGQVFGSQGREQPGDLAGLGQSGRGDTFPRGLGKILNGDGPLGRAGRWVELINLAPIRGEKFFKCHASHDARAAGESELKTDSRAHSLFR